MNEMDNRAEFDDEINLLDYLGVLQRHGKMIVILVAVSVVTTTIYSFLATEIFEARAVIMPANQQAEQGGMGAIAAQFGISPPSTSNAAEVVSLLESNILMERVIDNHNLMPVLFTKEEIAVMPAESRDWEGIRYLKNKIFKINTVSGPGIGRNKLPQGVIELTVEFKDPKKAAAILTSILTELTDYMSSEAKRVAETNKAYLESLIDKNADPLIRQKIYSLIARQIETSMMAEVKENFAFKILDPPKVPDERIRPKRAKNVILAFVIAVFAAVFAAFVREYVHNIRKGEGTAKEGKGEYAE